MLTPSKMTTEHNNSVWKASSFCHAEGASKHLDNSRVNLEALPNELLLYILSNTSTFSLEELYIVALVSRRFHALALPLFLAGHGISDPENEISLYVIEWNPNYVQTLHKPDALSGLNISTHITRINHFRCFFQEPIIDGRNTFQQAYDLPEAIQRTSRFVRTLKTIQSCEVYLVWDPYFLREKTAPHVPVAQIQSWKDAFSTLMNLVVERGVKSLRVQYDPHIDLPFHFRKVNFAKKILSHLSKGAVGDSGSLLQWELERPAHEQKSAAQDVVPATLSSSARSANCVTSLAIHSPTLILPPFINWTLSLLMEHSSLTSISFAYISFPREIWATILPYIADAVSHRLTELAFFRNCPHLDISDLLHFISRFPKLRRLSIDRTFRPRINPNERSLFPSRSIPSFPDLSELHTLQAPAELVSLLMDARKDPAKGHHSIPLPKLQHLTVYPCGLLIQLQSYISSSVVVSGLLSRIKSQPRVLTPTYAMDAQMEFTDFIPVVRYLDSVATQEEFRRTLRKSLSETEVVKLTQNQKNPVPHSAFDHVTHLLLHKFIVRYPDHTPSSLCLWLKLLFPDLKRLTFTCQLDAHAMQDFMIEEVTVQWLIRELRKQCPGVDVLVVGKTTYDL